MGRPFLITFFYSAIATICCFLGTMLFWAGVVGLFFNDARVSIMAGINTALIMLLVSLILSIIACIKLSNWAIMLGYCTGFLATFSLKSPFLFAAMFLASVFEKFGFSIRFAVPSSFILISLPFLLSVFLIINNLLGSDLEM